MPQNAFSFLLLSALLLPLKDTPQVLCMLGSEASSYDAYADQRPTRDAMELARRVSAALVSVCSPNCAPIVLFRNSTAPNVILLADSGQAKMVYSPEFFTAVYAKYGEGAILAIIAHMLGHAIDTVSPGGWIKTSWKPELSADAWTGCALAKSGLSLSGLESALRTLSQYPSSSSPAWAVRIPALRLGYTHCGGEGEAFDVRAGKISRK
jgi:hypothetical protein